MKVLLINGSPHRSGATFRALKEIIIELQKEGIETELIQVGMHSVRGCKGCGSCRTHELGKCIYGDDPVNVAIGRMESADALIVGSPVHYGGAAGDITSFMDRLFYASGGFPYKPGAAIVSCRRGGATSALEQLNKYFMMNNMPLVPSAYWNMVHGNNAEEVEQDAEGLMVMRTLARNMAWMLKSIEAGKKAGLALPPNEGHIRTNFVRDLAAGQGDDKDSKYKNFAPYFTSYNKVNKEYQEDE
ncbi:MAG: flavodoxin family protein [Eubacterium sp.]|nr:flavodoxin family protein [Eubacterium sp.]